MTEDASAHMNSYCTASLIDLLNEIAEFLEMHYDADGSSEGYKPNHAMRLYIAVEEELERLKRSSATGGEG